MSTDTQGRPEGFMAGGGGKLKIYRLRKNYRLKFFSQQKYRGNFFSIVKIVKKNNIIILILKNYVPTAWKLQAQKVQSINYKILKQLFCAGGAEIFGLFCSNTDEIGV